MLFISERVNNIVRVGLVAVIVLMIASSGFLAMSAQRAVSGQAAKSFADDADAVTDAITGRMDNYNDLLYQGRSLMAADSPPTQSQWETFFEDQQVLSRYGGISSLAYVERFDEGRKAAFVAKMKTQPEFGGTAFRVSPDIADDGSYAVASRLYSATDQRALSGFNVLSTAERRAVYQLADQSASLASHP